ncbi:MAG: hypothetical protein JRD89_21015 [Deltaproteobacteria bacterium]|nr:hypothetical protein [Deltaproteobacteria bacterium]
MDSKDKEVTRLERGWAGHFIAAHSCRFRRNTLLSHKDTEIVVSTVGLMENPLYKEKHQARGFSSDRFMEIGYHRHYETMAFHSDLKDARYHDADITKEVPFDSPWSISVLDADDKANDMHEAVVAEIMEGLQQGNVYKQRGDEIR